MKTAIRMMVAAVVIALVGAVGGEGVRGPAGASAAFEEVNDGIDIVQVCRVGEFQSTTEYPNSSVNSFRVVIANVSTATFGGTLGVGYSQVQKSGFTAVKNVILKTGRSMTVEVTIRGLVADRDWKLVLAIFPVGSFQQSKAWASQPLPAPQSILACNAF